MMRILAVIAATWVFGAGAKGQAAPKVLVFPTVQLDQAGPTEASASLSARVAQTLRRQGLNVVEHGTKSRAHRRKSQLPAAVQKAFREGKRLLRRLKHREAAAKFEEAVEGFVRFPQHLESFDTLAQAQVMLAECLFRTGQQTRGVAVFEELVTMRPDWELQEGKYPPVFIREFRSARGRVLGRDRGRLDMRGTAQSIRLNGFAVSALPVRILDLPPGQHIVVADEQAHRVRIESHKTWTLELEGEIPGKGDPLHRRIAINVLSPTLRSELFEQAQAQGAEFVYVSAVAPNPRGNARWGGYVGKVDGGQWASLREVQLGANLSADEKTVAMTADAIKKQVESFRSGIVTSTTTIVRGRTRRIDDGRSGKLQTLSFMRLAGSPTDKAESSTRRVPLAAAPMDVPKEKESAPPATGEPVNLEAQADASASEEGLTSKWWFWGAIGVGVTAAVGTYFLLRDPGDEVDVVVQW